MKQISFVFCALFLLIQPAHATPLNINGFETGDSTECQSTTGTQSVQGTTKRTGGYALKVNPATSATGNCRMAKLGTTGTSTTAFDVATLYQRFYMNITTAPASGDEEINLILDTGATQKAAVRLNSARKLVFYNNADSLVATGATVLSTGTWYRIEIKTGTAAASGAAYDVQIDGVSEFSGTANLLNSNNGSVRIGKGADKNSQSVELYFDDYQANDAAFPGAGQISRMAVDSDGSSQTWVTGTGATFAEVDEVPTDGDTTYLGGATSGAALVGFESSSSAGISGTINGVKAYTSFREGVDGSATTVVRVRAGGTNSDSAASNLGTSYLSRFRFLTVDPSDSGAWTTSDLDGIEAGLNEGTVAQVNRLTTVGMYVDYSPSSDTPTPTPTATPTATPTNTPTPTPTPAPVALRLLTATGVGQ